MAERTSPGRLRGWLRVSLVLLAVLYVASDALKRDDDEESGRAEESSAGVEGTLAITRLKPAEVPPGGAAVVTLSGLDASPSNAVLAFVDKKPAEVVYRRGADVVVRIPEGPLGHHRLRMQQAERRTKGYDVWVKPLPRRKIIHGLVGGLALFVLGLRTLQQGLRAYAGGRLKDAITRYTGSLPRGLGLGVLAGAITQSTASAAGVLVSMIESDLLALGPALSMLLGAQLGAALALLALPLVSAREGLLIVAVGVAFLGLSNDRRAGAVGSMVLGVGLLQYGVQLLRNGLQPLVSDPALLPYVKHFASGGARGLFASAAAGVAIAALTQGPSALFALTLGLAQTSGLISVREALAILSGTALGSALGSAVVVWPFGPTARRLALGYLMVGLGSTIAVLCSLPAWTALSSGLPASALGAIATGGVVGPAHVGPRLAVGFVSSQFALALCALPLLPPLARTLGRRRGAQPEVSGKSRLDAAQVRARVSDALKAAASVLDLALRMMRERDRALASELDAALRSGRALLDVLLSEVAAAAAVRSPEGASIVALCQAHESLASLSRLCERGLEQGVELDAPDLAALHAMHERVVAALEALRSSLRGAKAPSLEQARVIEIRINAEERDQRQRLTESLRGADGATVSRRAHAMGVLAAYETFGNQLFRAHEALLGDLD